MKQALGCATVPSGPSVLARAASTAGGAAVGTVVGATVGASRAEGSSASVQRRYAKGHQVPIPVR